MTIIIPVYYTKVWKRIEKIKTWLLSLNWFRNSHHFEQNDVKHHMTELITIQLKNMSPIKGQYSVTYRYYYKNEASDLPNVGPLSSKYLLDTLQLLKLVQNDNVKYLKEEHYYAVAKDINNPRIEATITELKD